jgi:hypothetical protein
MTEAIIFEWSSYRYSGRSTKHLFKRWFVGGDTRRGLVILVDRLEDLTRRWHIGRW